MLDLGEGYLSKMRQNLFKGILHSIALQQYHENETIVINFTQPGSFLNTFKDNTEK